MSIVTARPEHQIAYQDIVALFRRHADSGIGGLELLAIASNAVGKMVALQDQTKVTPRMAMEVVARNIEGGNQEAIDELLQSKGGTA